MEMALIFEEILQINGENRLDKTLEIAKDKPYFEIAQIAKFVFDKHNIPAKQNAALFTQNNWWLQYLVTPATNDIQELNTTGINGDAIQQEVTINPTPVNPEEELQNNEEPDIALKEPITETWQNLPVVAEIPINLTPVNQEQELQKNEEPDIAPKEPIMETGQEFPVVAEVPVTQNPVTLYPVEMEQLEPVIAIEPYYTVDYFAAQGVKMQQNLLQNDKLGKQVKSFTDWLKSMKKVEKTVHIQPDEPQNDTDIHIVSLAEKSLKKEAIITETMADVLIQQGKTKEAILVLEKLSLQDTEKSSYFASRINELKTN